MAKNDNESEQKSLPPSEKKLRDGRRKGQVPSSRDLISGFGLLTMIIYLLMVGLTVRDHILELLNLVSRVSDGNFETSLRMALDASMKLIGITLIPAIACLLITSVIAGMIGTYGPVFSFDPVKPNFDHINPAKGIKRIFSVRNVVEFAKSFTKVLILGTVLFLVLRSWLQPMFHAANCGEHCLGPLLLASLMPIVIVAALSFITIGFLDVRLQRWLFVRDMRMTKTEHKRERKDIEGDPLILGERRRLRQRESRILGRLGVPSASIVIVGPDHLAALRYHPTKSPLPIIVAKARSERVQALRDEARQLGIPTTDDAALAKALAEQHAVGDSVQPQHFPAVARVLIASGLT
ncbi:MAG: EscU/YscU/HrcU family type III secretion system export apparatus switch protein [Rhodomicrobiaceae bacterium]